MIVRIIVYVRRDFRPDLDDRASAMWIGDPGWGSAPNPDVHHWAHCGEWTAEKFDRVFFEGPAADGTGRITCEVEIDPVDVALIRHLIDEHGFTGET